MFIGTNDYPCIVKAKFIIIDNDKEINEELSISPYEQVFISKVHTSFIYFKRYDDQNVERLERSGNFYKNDLGCCLIIDEIIFKLPSSDMYHMFGDILRSRIIYECKRLDIDVDNKMSKFFLFDKISKYIIQLKLKWNQISLTYVDSKGHLIQRWNDYNEIF